MQLSQRAAWSFLSLLCVAVVGNCAGVAAAQQVSVPKDAQALAVIQQALSAMGVSQALGYQDAQVSGTLSLNNTPSAQYPVVIKSKGNGMARYEVTTASGVRVRILNNGQAAIQYATGKVKRLIANNTLGERVNYIPALSLLSDYQNSTVAVESLSTAQVGGSPAYVVVLSIASGANAAQTQQSRDITRVRFYIDQVTGLLLKTRRMEYGENDPNVGETVETVFAKYQAIGGLLVPMQQSTYVDGQLESTLTINSISFNVGLSSTDFTLPN